MPDNSTISIIYFDVFELDLKDGELRKEGLAVKLAPQPFKILAMLASRAGQIVIREEIQRAVWGEDTFVDFDLGLNQCIRQIRTALGDDSQNPKFIETLSRRGYRFIPPVKEAKRLEAEISDSGEQAVDGFPPMRIDIRPGDIEPSPQEGPAADVKRARKQLAGRLSVKRTVGIAVAAILVAVVVLALIIEAFGPRSFWTELFRRGQGKTIRSLAVLPFRNLSGDPEQEYFAEGMTDQLITDLAQIPSLRVISRTSTTQYRDSRKALPTIARELSVDAVVEGTVTRSGSRVRVTAQLVQAEPEKHLWAKSYERSMGDALNLQGEVAEAIAAEIRVKLPPQEGMRLTPYRFQNPAAEDAYLKGHYYFQKGRSQWNQSANAPLNKSIGYFRQAITIDPSFSLAYTGLATAYDALLTTEVRDATHQPGAVSAKAKAAALKALQIDGESAQAHAALAWNQFVYDWDWPGAEAEFKRAIALDPGYATGHYWYAMYLSAMGRHDQAIAEIRLAERLDPISSGIRFGGGWVFYEARRYDETIQEDQAALALSPNSARAHFALGWVSVKRGLFQQAASEFQKGAILSGGDTQTLDAYMGYLDAASGKRQDAFRMIRLLNAKRPPASISSYVIAEIYAALGEKDLAFTSLEKSYQEHQFEMTYLKVDPDLDSLRSDPRFTDLLRRMHLPQLRTLLPRFAPPDDL